MSTIICKNPISNFPFWWVLLTGCRDTAAQILQTDVKLRWGAMLDWKLLCWRGFCSNSAPLPPMTISFKSIKLAEICTETLENKEEQTLPIEPQADESCAWVKEELYSLWSLIVVIIDCRKIRTLMRWPLSGCIGLGLFCTFLSEHSSVKGNLLAHGARS